MNNKNLEKLIEQYKREMLSYSRRSTLPPEPPAPEPRMMPPEPSVPQVPAPEPQPFAQPENMMSVQQERPVTAQKNSEAIPVAQGFDLRTDELDNLSSVQSDDNRL